MLQTVGQDFQLLGQFVLLAELLAQQHQVARGVVQRDVAQVQTPASEVVQVHHAGNGVGGGGNNIRSEMSCQAHKNTVVRLL